MKMLLQALMFCLLGQIGTQAANAGVLNELENRCLPALEDGDQPDVSGLVFAPSAASIADVVTFPDPSVQWSGWMSVSGRFAIAVFDVDAGTVCELMVSHMLPEQIIADWETHVTKSDVWRESLELQATSIGSDDMGISTLRGFASKPVGDGFAVLALSGLTTPSVNFHYFTISYAPKQNVFCRAWREECQ